MNSCFGIFIFRIEKWLRRYPAVIGQIMLHEVLWKCDSQIRFDFLYISSCGCLSHFLKHVRLSYKL